ncbi:ABC transporter substrate-binding protein [Nitratireductor alexandrii]|uniref:ABC transporter substrate-binding protein n=1 Tax=Nitratireductor alexandrii TaxID=2448161 RepID=UPI000FD79DB0|nr:ABC transporter substrate-binding protein [Nitratireductor alexandrii]
MRISGICTAFTALLLASSAQAETEVTLHSGLGPAEGATLVDVSKYEARRDGAYTIGFSNVFTGNSWVVQLLEEAAWRAEQFPEIERYIVTDANFDPSKQVADVEDMLAQGVDAIVINPTSPVAIVPVLEKAYDAGVAVIIVAADAETDKATVRILADQVKFGRDGGEFLAEAMGNEGKVIALRGIAGISVDTDRWAGAEEVFAKHPGIEVVGEVYAQWAYDQGRQACESLALAHPQIDGVWSSGGAMTQACIEVFNELGRDLVPMTGEANNGFFGAWKKNQEAGFDSIAPQNPTWMVAEGVAAAVAVLNGQEVYTQYKVVAEPYTSKDLDTLYRPDLNDSYWVGSILPDDKLKELYGN